MTTTKKSYGFRLSEQAQKHLLEIQIKTGMNQTAIVEIAIVKLFVELQGVNGQEPQVVQGHGCDNNHYHNQIS